VSPLGEALARSVRFEVEEHYEAERARTYFQATIWLGGTRLGTRRSVDGRSPTEEERERATELLELSALKTLRDLEAGVAAARQELGDLWGPA